MVVESSYVRLWIDFLVRAQKIAETAQNFARHDTGRTRYAYPTSAKCLWALTMYSGSIIGAHNFPGAQDSY